MNHVKYDVVIVDSGIDKNHDYYKNLEYAIDSCKLIYNENNTLRACHDCIDKLGHGTAVTSIICQKSLPVKALMIQAFDNEEMVDEMLLINILEYIMLNIDSKIIHLSCGVSSCENKGRLYSICQQLTDKGSIIVASFCNDGALSYPAAFDNVIGVDSSYRCRKKSEFIYLENSPINIRAIGITQYLPGINNTYTKLCGASFASPHVTFFILKRIKNKGYNREQILKELRKNSKSIMDNDDKEHQTLPQKAFTIKKAIILPFNKEIHSILRYYHQLNFEVKGFYDCPLLVHKNESYFNSIANGEYQLQSWDIINWNDDFDTIIIGHLTQMNDLMHKDYLDFFLGKCISYHKNVFSFDPLYNYSDHVSAITSNGNKAYFPSIEGCFTNANWMGKMAEIVTPVVLIAGTSKRQGKFSLQLALREELIRRGYLVGQLSTEPSGELFGMDFVYPNGFNSQIKTNGKSSISNIRYLMDKIQDNHPDIILVGTQSHIAPKALNNTSIAPLSNYEVLFGTDPAAFLIVVNIDDDLEYIKRSIQICEGGSLGEVIGLCISPIKQDDNWTSFGSSVKYASLNEIKEKENELSNRFGLDVFTINESSRITSAIIEFFSE